ncbi:MAG TPA: VacJ family lipoprotein [Wenzhouxiangellaceae bacterium]|nr:VacJ family lipoprotein [Wenzhouxiangellaceae bacterium]
MRYRALITAVLASLLAACATTAPPPEQRDPVDPWEPYNRNMYQFNRTLDKAIIRPVAIGYERVVPDPVETGITNFFANLQSLPTIINLTLQGRPADTVTSIVRFTMNSVFGLAGFFDVATRSGVPKYDEDLGQTLAVWGWEDSRYFVIPFLGPSTLRDGLARPVDSYADVVWREAVNGREYGIAVNLIQMRANLLGREEQLEDAFDEYLFVRDAWLQNREFKITGESATPDYDSFLEDDDWDDSVPEENPGQ